MAPQEKPRMNGDLVDPNSTPHYHGDLVPENRQRDMQSALNRHRTQTALGGAAMQKIASGSSAKTLEQIAKNPVKSGMKLAFGIFKQIDFDKDWPYLFLLMPFALLKDIFDIALAAIPGVGIVVSFLTTMMLTIFTTICLLMMGEGFSARKVGKYIAGLGIEFISEAIPGLDWLPFSTIDTVVIYGFVLADRVMQSSEREGHTQGIIHQKSSYSSTFTPAEK